MINELWSLRHTLTPSELLALMGRIVVWTRATSRPESGQPAALEGPILVVDGFEHLLERFVSHAARTSRTAALVHESTIRYERIDDRTLRGMALAAYHSILAAPQELADALVSWWISVGMATEDVSPPPEVASTMLQLLKTAPGETVYCLGPGAQTAAIECMRQGRLPIVVTAHRPLLALLYSLITGVEISVVLHEPLSPEAFEHFKKNGRKPTLAVPLFGGKATDFEARGWHSSRAGLRTMEGRMVELIDQYAASRAVVLIPNGVLFRSGAEQRLRQHLVERGRVHSVVSFPPGLLGATSVPFSLVVLDTEHSSDEITVCEIDPRRHIKTSPGMLKHRARQFTGERDLLDALHAGSGPCRRVTRSEVKAVDYNLSANRHRASADAATYKMDVGAKLVPFETIATIVKPQAFRSLDSDAAISIGEVSPGELPPFAFLTKAERYRRIDPWDRERFDQQRLLHDDVLLSTKGTIGRTGIASPDAAAGEIFPSQSIIILRLSPRSPIGSPVALMMFLRSPYFQHLLQSLVVGTTIPNVSLTALRRLMVRIPTAQEQNELVRIFESQRQLQQQVTALSEQQREMERNAWKSTGLALPET